MSLSPEEKPFSINLFDSKKKISLDIIPFHYSNRLLYRVVSSKLPDLVVELTIEDTWEQVGGEIPISISLLGAIGDMIENARR